jgi:hypothetical protein
MKEVLGEDDTATRAILNTLSLALMDQRKWADAKDILSELVTKQKKIHGKHHPHTLTSLYCLSACLFRRENFDEAEKVLQEVVEGRETILGKNHPHTAHSRKTLEYVIKAQGARRSFKNQPPSSPSIGSSSPK